MHPYKELPEDRFWKTAVAGRIWSEVDFKPTTRFKLSPQEKIATAGSCFAQHIAGNLGAFGLNHFITEPAPRILSQERASQLQYGVFSARYGNIYTARQLRQLIEFAFGLRQGSTICEEAGDGWIDLLRPGVQAEGFPSQHDLECDRLFHLECVKRIFLESDCFIFTLGLTEFWYDRGTNLAFPTCPGVRGGTFNPEHHLFANASVSEVVRDLRWCIDFVATQNPKLKWILTVSPVALSATGTTQHVLVASSASKAILRAAAEEIYLAYSCCEYFPSYEITLAPPSFGQFLDSDLRSISSRGVMLAMRLFHRVFLPSTTHFPTLTETSPHLEEQVARAVEAECDEFFNDPGAAK
ncbi:MAG: GSCFA domain-containing protein [Dechloromonas sp.]|uniref:GSCFA domain-containing protein n=1 Tax=Azonexus hydrophilus TaxID=418702 RepID=UPI00249116A8|nr:GSCFA domain-containing protein [Azonexus hydrophilus]MCA1937692.1 GSCFA domain-containing protein [Dechloromonas sp.]